MKLLLIPFVFSAPILCAEIAATCPESATDQVFRGEPIHAKYVEMKDYKVRQVRHDDSVVELDIELNVGAKSSFSLPSNPSTGYLWICQPTPIEGLRVDILQLAPKNKQLMGSPAGTVVTIIADKAGEYSFRLLYKRPWEKDTPPVKEQIFKVTVKKS